MTVRNPGSMNNYKALVSGIIPLYQKVLRN